MRNWGAPLALLAAVGALVAVPVVLRRDRPAVPDDAAQVIVITPNNEQIRQEFGVNAMAPHEADPLHLAHRLLH